MKILALDMATTTGWATNYGGSGTFKIGTQRGESPGVRYIRLQHKLEAICADHGKPDLVVYEQAHHRGGAATEYAVGCSTHVQSWCAIRGIEHTSVHSAHIKKFITGKGNAEKDAVIAAVRARGFSPMDDNHADAIAIMLFAQANFGRAK
jgi:Holliday junction resolvasome RuvABC endonuclease subunit